MNDETDGETVRWMSYAELGRLRGTSAATARRMANRKRWKKLPGNDGTVRVAVPGEITVSRETEPETLSETSRETLSQAIAALETAVTTLSQQLTDARVDRERLEGDLRMAIAAHQEAIQAAEALRQAEADRKARGVLARLRAAWRGE